MIKVRKFKYQRIAGTAADHCCVPLCQASSRYNSVLSFFSFPADDELRRRWVVAIRRNNFVITHHTRVCSRHFNREDFRDPTSERGRRRLKTGVVPVLFDWNHFSLPPPRPAVWDRRQRPSSEVEGEDFAPDRVLIVSREHDYASAAVGLMLEENHQLRQQVERLTLQQRFGIHRFAASDKDIRFFTRFSSNDLLMRFWALIEPFLPSLGHVQQTQRGHLTDSSTAHSLQPVDELFLFLNYLALGSKQQDLADRYSLQPSTVSWLITSWSSFLYSLLGSVRIWIPEEQVRKSLPAEFKDYPDTTVILDRTELRCQRPSSCVLRSEGFPTDKPRCTVKGLVGIAPHGAVTFISELYAGSIGDEQITRESGILTLLAPGMAVMVDRGFLIDDIIPCKLYRPAFAPAAGVRETQATAHLRVHVERLVRRVKEHKFFDSEIPPCLFGSVSQLYTVACLLTNYENGPLVKARTSKPRSKQRRDLFGRENTTRSHWMMKQPPEWTGEH
ncbi:uncharacterized protein FYW61_002183 [Anableps anableps]